MNYNNPDTLPKTFKETCAHEVREITLLLEEESPVVAKRRLMYLGFLACILGDENLATSVQEELENQD